MRYQNNNRARCSVVSLFLMEFTFCVVFSLHCLFHRDVNSWILIFLKKEDILPYHFLSFKIYKSCDRCTLTKPCLNMHVYVSNLTPDIFKLTRVHRCWFWKNSRIEAIRSFNFCPVKAYLLIRFFFRTKYTGPNRIQRLSYNCLSAPVYINNSYQNMCFVLQGGNSGIIKLFQGQHVWIESSRDIHTILGGYEDHVTTFSGALLRRIWRSEKVIEGIIHDSVLSFIQTINKKTWSWTNAHWYQGCDFFSFLQISSNQLHICWTRTYGLTARKMFLCALYGKPFFKRFRLHIPTGCLNELFCKAGRI